MVEYKELKAIVERKLKGIPDLQQQSYYYRSKPFFSTSKSKFKKIADPQYPNRYLPMKDRPAVLDDPELHKELIELIIGDQKRCRCDLTSSNISLVDFWKKAYTRPDYEELVKEHVAKVEKFKEFREEYNMARQRLASDALLGIEQDVIGSFNKFATYWDEEFKRRFINAA